MIPAFKIPDMLLRLQLVTNESAEFLEILQKNIRGKGLSPAEAPLVEMKLKELEIQLRTLGADEDQPVPFNHGVKW